MSAYIVAMIEITDPQGYADYRAQTPDLIAKYGGRFLVRGGELDIKEGDWPHPRVVVIEFRDMESAQAFYHSPEYQAILPLRTNHAVGNLAVIPGAEI